MLNKLKKSNEGFTIIEVMIVLAIAGLIMLIVFLAVPALQRNSRNTQRANDGSRIVAAVNECLNNNNGRVLSCNSLTAVELNTYIDVADNQQLTAAGAAALNAASLNFGQRCNNTGTTSGPGGGTRSFTVTYLVESRTGTPGRCLGS